MLCRHPFFIVVVYGFKSFVYLVDLDVYLKNIFTRICFVNFRVKYQIMIEVQNYTSHFISMWKNSSESLPFFPKQYDSGEKKEREARFELIQQQMQAFQKQANIRKLKQTKPESVFFPMFRTFLQDVFDFEPDQLSIILSDQFKHVSREFFYAARKFGPELTPENIYQGLRNVWIMNGLQLMLDKPVEITPSVFAYSMIYPYSDNLLDDPVISFEEKKDFSIRFYNRLKGEKTEPKSFTESQLFKLVSMFEEQYDRKSFPEVYESLLAIHNAQTESLKLVNTGLLNQSEILRICFEKGGTSVLADGYLVAGKLTQLQERALMGYGIYLQLLDDIQDAKEDAAAQTTTVCSKLTGEPMERFVNRTVLFGRKALEEMKNFGTNNNNVFLNLMNKSIETMIIESVGLNNAGYSREYLSLLEKHSPLHFDFVRQKRSQSKSHRLAMFRKIFEQSAQYESALTF